MRVILVVLALALLSGCAGFGQVERVSDLSVGQLKQMKDIQFLEGDEGLNYRSLGKVKGISCKGSAFSGDTDKEAALTQLKINGSIHQTKVVVT